MLHPAFITHQRARWMRSDGACFIRPDAAKFLTPGTDPADVYPALAPRRDAIRRADARAFDDAVAGERAVLDGLRDDLARITSDLAWRRMRRAIAEKYNPDQPRVPAAGNGPAAAGAAGDLASSSAGAIRRMKFLVMADNWTRSLSMARTITPVSAIRRKAISPTMTACHSATRSLSAIMRLKLVASLKEIARTTHAWSVTKKSLSLVEIRALQSLPR